jgi:2-hydroxy-6-oxonona-2,4-dienedioate hydrolase
MNARRWLLAVVALLVLAPALAVGIAYAKFRFWHAEIVEGLHANSEIAQTARGPVEYAIIGSGVPALMVHGTPGGYDQIYELMKLGIARGEPQHLRAIIPSRPGYLRTPLSVGDTPEKQADAFKALLDQLGIQKVAVFGLSGGGPSAIRFVLQYPDRCAALVLESAITMALEETPEDADGTVDRFVQTEFGRWLFADLFIAGMEEAAPGNSKIRPMAEIVIRSTYPFALRDAGRINDGRQFTEIGQWPLERIDCPTLIVHGTADRNVPFSHAQRAHDAIAGSELRAFDGGDHFISITRSSEIDALVGEFVAAHAGSQQ